MSNYRMHYIDQRNLRQGVIDYRFPNDSKIAIIGDYGTGLTDSIILIRDAILEKEADIIIHLGDVYYAGTPNEYVNNVANILNEARKLAKEKMKKNVLFYSIPGNHDYYSWGLPFLCFISTINEVKLITDLNIDEDEVRQRSSYFCLRSQDNRWQFIGLDTAYNDSNPLNQINPSNIGPTLR